MNTAGAGFHTAAARCPQPPHIGRQGRCGRRSRYAEGPGAPGAPGGYRYGVQTIHIQLHPLQLGGVNHVGMISTPDVIALVLRLLSSQEHQAPCGHLARARRWGLYFKQGKARPIPKQPEQEEAGDTKKHDQATRCLSSCALGDRGAASLAQRVGDEAAHAPFPSGFLAVRHKPHGAWAGCGGRHAPPSPLAVGVCPMWGMPRMGDTSPPWGPVRRGRGARLARGGVPSPHPAVSDGAL